MPLWCRQVSLRKLWDSLSEERSSMCERRLEKTVLRAALLPVKIAQFTQFFRQVRGHTVKSLSLTWECITFFRDARYEFQLRPHDSFPYSHGTGNNWHFHYNQTIGHDQLRRHMQCKGKYILVWGNNFFAVWLTKRHNIVCIMFKDRVNAWSYLYSLRHKHEY
jgi:hypothetical protein